MTVSAGQFIEADHINSLASVSDTQNTSGTTTSTSYTATLTGGTACGIAFVAPASGKVTIKATCAMSNSGANVSYCTARVRTGSSIGSGSDVVAADDSNAVYILGTDGFRGSVNVPVSGLTPGASYNVQQLFRVTGGTGTFIYKNLIVTGSA